MSTAVKYDKYGAVHSQTSARVDWKITNNGTWEDAVQFDDPDDQTWDLVGATFEMDVRANPYDADPLMTLTSANGRIIIDDPVQRVIHFLVQPADIQANLNPGTYVYDLVMIYDTDVRVPLMHGTVQVAQGVSDLVA